MLLLNVWTSTKLKCLANKQKSTFLMPCAFQCISVTSNVQKNVQNPSCVSVHFLGWKQPFCWSTLHSGCSSFLHMTLPHCYWQVEVRPHQTTWHDRSTCHPRQHTLFVDCSNYKGSCQLGSFQYYFINLFYHIDPAAKSSEGGGSACTPAICDLKLNIS